MAVLGYLPKLKRDLGLAFGAYLLHDFFYKNVSYLIINHWTKILGYTFFPSENIEQNMLLSFYLDN